MSLGGAAGATAPTAGASSAVPNTARPGPLGARGYRAESCRRRERTADAPGLVRHSALRVFPASVASMAEARREVHSVIEFSAIADETWLSLAVEESFDTLVSQLETQEWVHVTQISSDGQTWHRCVVNASAVAYVREKAYGPTRRS